jgi:glutathione-independent formaldehyde dehydrogenase
MAGVKPGSVVYRCAGGSLACASSCQLLGAAIVIVGDLNEERLAHARSFGCETINLTNIPVQEQL